MSTAEQYVGMTKKGAQNLAEARNMIFRLISIDDEPFLEMPEDERSDRVCVRIANGKVIEAVIR